jgi:hypothetical protein
MRDVSPRDRSIRNVPVSGGSHRRTQNPRFRGDIPLPKKKKRGGFVWWALGILVACVVAGLLLSTLFEGATVTLTPKMASITPPANLTAMPGAPAGSLGYQTVSLSQSATTTAPANGVEHVSKPASGVVIISNTSTSVQKIKTRARLAAPDGKIYLTNSALTIPAKGNVTATITAEAPGEAYNKSAVATFTLPGLKGDPLYTKITGHLQGALTGGFVGDKPAIAAADMKKAQDTLKTQLDSRLANAVLAGVPKEFMPVQGSAITTYSDLALSPAGSSTVTLSQSGRTTLAMVSSGDLASMLAKLLVQGYAGEAVKFKNPNPLVLQIAPTTAKTPTGPLTMLLQGNPTLVWQFDQNAVKEDLLGKNKAVFQTIIETFSPAIDSAEASIRPFWKARFPSDPDKLIVIVKE